jgi:twinkle protein
MWFYNHFGSLESKNLITKLRYLATVCKVDFILLDHVSIVTSGIESSSEGERKDIDILMTRLRQLIEETGVGVQAIVHLKRTQKNFNEGDQVSLNDLRGSASLEQLSDNVIALERNQQGDNPTQVRLRVLKCREMGDLGEADLINYNRQTGRYELDASTPFDEVLE